MEVSTFLWTAFNSIHSHLLLFNFNKKKTGEKNSVSVEWLRCAFFFERSRYFRALFLFGRMNTHQQHSRWVLTEQLIYSINTWVFFTFTSVSSPSLFVLLRAFYGNVRQFHWNKLPTISMRCSLLTRRQIVRCVMFSQLMAIAINSWLLINSTVNIKMHVRSLVCISLNSLALMAIAIYELSKVRPKTM